MSSLIPRLETHLLGVFNDVSIAQIELVLPRRLPGGPVSSQDRPGFRFSLSGRLINISIRRSLSNLNCLVGTVQTDFAVKLLPGNAEFRPKVRRRMLNLGKRIPLNQNCVRIFKSKPPEHEHEGYMEKIDAGSETCPVAGGRGKDPRQSRR